MSARKRNQAIESQGNIDSIWEQDLKASKEHHVKVNYTLETSSSDFRHVQPLLEMNELSPSKQKH